jgi:hypothetical protein
VLLRVDESEDLSKKKGEEINTIKKEKETIESSLSYNTCFRNFGRCKGRI